LTTPADPLAPMRTRGYVRLLLLAAVLGLPISATAYWYLKLVALLQGWVFTDLPGDLGFHGEPGWWPLLPLTLAGVLVGPAIRYLPGRGGHSPADGFKAGGVVQPAELPGIALASLAGLSLGVVIGPEAPLIAIGGGLAFLAVKLASRDVPPQTGVAIAAAGSFAAISTLLGSPLAGAFLLMEASGLGGAAATIVLVPGLLGAGIGSLIFLGLNSLTGYGTFSLAVPHLPAFAHLDVTEFGWAVATGVIAAFGCWAIKWLALAIRPHVERRILLLTPVIGLAIGGLAAGYAEITGKPSADVLFSGQSELGPLIMHSAGYTAGALLLLVACKGVAYTGALSSFRGGPIFPAMFIGAAGGLALSHLPGLPLIAGVGIGMGAMIAGMLRLPMTAVLLTTLFLGSDGIAAMPLVIVAVVLSYVISTWLAGPPGPAASPATAPAASPAASAPAARAPAALPASPAAGGAPSPARLVDWAPAAQPQEE
jgi:H+/Cl- antiporter ClcA